MMKNTRLILLILYEVVSVILVYRLWTRDKRLGVVERCFLSVVLLVPFFGWIFYGFLKIEPDAHGEDVGDHSTGGGVGDSGHHF
jgi:hypothetical protein